MCMNTGLLIKLQLTFQNVSLLIQLFGLEMIYLSIVTLIHILPLLKLLFFFLIVPLEKCVTIKIFMLDCTKLLFFLKELQSNKLLTAGTVNGVGNNFVIEEVIYPLEMYHNSHWHKPFPSSKC